MAITEEPGRWVPLDMRRGWGDIELTAGFVLQELRAVGAKTCVETGVLSHRDYKLIKSYLFQHGGWGRKCPSEGTPVSWPGDPEKEAQREGWLISLASPREEVKYVWYACAVSVGPKELNV